MHKASALGFWLLAMGLSMGQAHGAPAKGSTRTSASTTTSTASQAGPGYKVAPVPAWVKDPGSPSSAAPKQLGENTRARRDLLIDNQVLLTDQGQSEFLRLRRVALDTSTLKEVSEPTVLFNPAYQRLTLHTVQVVRNGQRIDRLRDAKVEVMRREQQLERQVLDGMHTALIMLRDVRVGDEVEVAYTVEGRNPIFEGRFSELFHLASDAPANRIHIRLEAPRNRTLQVKGVPIDVNVERTQEGDRQVLRVTRDHVSPPPYEEAVPPWFKVFPAIHVSEYASWDDVEQWAQRLFADTPPTGEVARRIDSWKQQNLSREALLADVLRFVQDDVRYFSTSLGESSHRPHPAAQTLKDRMGDCKDKVLLLNTLLKGLGFEVYPALVSTYRHRSLGQYLPSHDQFDHVVSAVTLDGQRYLLDATLNGQGLTLRNRGYLGYGQALIVGEHKGVQSVSPPAFALDQVNYRQDWDASNMTQPTQLTVNIQAKGLAAERWRAAVANAGLERITDTIAGTYIRINPGMRLLGKPELNDQRDQNQLDLTLKFEHPQFGEYRQGALESEMGAFELMEYLSVPAEGRRQFPYWLSHTRLVEQRTLLKTPRPFGSNPPAPQQVQDKHFQLSARTEVKGNELLMVSRYERRNEEVLPVDLKAYREAILRARQLTGQKVRMLLIDRASLESVFSTVVQRLEPYQTRRSDALLRILQEQEFTRLSADRVLPLIQPRSPLAAQVLSNRAIANNLMGDFTRGLVDAQAALAIDDKHNEALEARGVALLGLDRTPEALDAFQQRQAQGASSANGLWLGIAQYMNSDFASAEQTLRTQLGDTGGEERSFTLSWLHLAAERQMRGRGVQLLSDELGSEDRQKWPGVLPHYLQGNVSEDALLKLARSDAEQERLRLAEAHFFIGQKHLIQGRPAEARRAFELALATKAVPYREVTLANLELKRLRSQP